MGSGSGITDRRVVLGTGRRAFCLGISPEKNERKQSDYHERKSLKQGIVLRQKPATNYEYGRVVLDCDHNLQFKTGDVSGCDADRDKHVRDCHSAGDDPPGGEVALLELEVGIDCQHAHQSDKGNGQSDHELHGFSFRFGERASLKFYFLRPVLSMGIFLKEHELVCLLLTWRGIYDNLSGSPCTVVFGTWRKETCPTTRTTSRWVTSFCARSSLVGWSRRGWSICSPWSRITAELSSVLIRESSTTSWMTARG